MAKPRRACMPAGIGADRQVDIVAKFGELDDAGRLFGYSASYAEKQTNGDELS